MRMKKRGNMMTEYLGWWILALIALIIGILVIVLLSGKNTEVLQYFKDLLRFGR